MRRHGVLSNLSAVMDWTTAPIFFLKKRKTLYTQTEPSLFEGLGYKTSGEIENPQRIYDPSKNNVFAFFLLFFFLCWNIVNWDAYTFPLQLFEHHAVWLEDPFKLSNCINDPIHWRVRVTYFYSWGEPAKLRNREKRCMSVYLVWQ